MKNKKRILICPLDWGLGHASRCIPVIRELIDNDIEVVVGADNGPLALLKREFPQLEFIEFPGYNIEYSKNGNMPMAMMLSLPRVLGGIYREHAFLKSLIKNLKIDAVISDNRFGLWNSTVPTVFITHQVMVKCPKHLKFMEPVIHRINEFFIGKYDECWIPDIEGRENLSADLSHRYPLPRNAEFIGHLSRFDSPPRPEGRGAAPCHYDLMAIISGPEPQRSIFEKAVLKQLERTSLKAIVVRGVPEKKPPPAPPLGGRAIAQGNRTPPNLPTGQAGEIVILNEAQRSEEPPTSGTYGGGAVEIYPHLETCEMQRAMLASKLILSRPGYSTIMDLAVLGKKAIFVPTPGQTEQEYLADLFHKKGVFCKISQEDFSSEGGLKSAMAKSVEYKGIELADGGLLLRKRVNSFIEAF